MNKMFRVFPTLEKKVGGELEIDYHESRITKVAKMVYQKAYVEYFKKHSQKDYVEYFKKHSKAMSYELRILKANKYACGRLNEYYNFQEKLRTRPD